MAAFFDGGAIGSGLGGWAYAIGNWDLASSVECGFAVLAFGLFLTDFLENEGTGLLRGSDRGEIRPCKPRRTDKVRK
jgi:hypothetical protein